MEWHFLRVVDDKTNLTNSYENRLVLSVHCSCTYRFNASLTVKLMKTITSVVNPSMDLCKVFSQRRYLWKAKFKITTMIGTSKSDYYRNSGHVTCNKESGEMKEYWHNWLTKMRKAWVGLERRWVASPEGNREFCFQRISMFPKTKSNGSNRLKTKNPFTDKWCVQV